MILRLGEFLHVVMDFRGAWLSPSSFCRKKRNAIQVDRYRGFDTHVFLTRNLSIRSRSSSDIRRLNVSRRMRTFDYKIFGVQAAEHEERVDYLSAAYMLCARPAI